MYMETDVKHILFIDECRATLYGTDRCTKGWVFYENHARLCMPCQQGIVGVSFCGGIMGEIIIGPFKMSGV